MVLKLRSERFQEKLAFRWLPNFWFASGVVGEMVHFQHVFYSTSSVTRTSVMALVAP